MDEKTNLMDKITSLAKRRGFFYPGSELYGGVANTYDYGPVGAELLRNIRNLWWDTFVHERDDIVGLDASMISHQEVWKASGHTAGFADAMVDCKNCRLRMRADHLIEGYWDLNIETLQGLDTDVDVLPKERFEKFIKTGKVEGYSSEELGGIIRLLNIPCPNCQENKGDKWTDVRRFNLLFPVNLGIVEGDQSLAYLRGETAQGMFVNFKNVLASSRVKLPFGIAQLGKSFRNEITPGNAIFRTLEFEQGEIEYFFDPDQTKWEKLFEAWKRQMWDFVTKSLGVSESNLRWREHSDEERSFYSKRTEDLEYQFPFGHKELWGLAYRTDYDLLQHQTASKKDLQYIDPVSNKRFIPHVIEPAVGINRLFLMVLSDAYSEEGERVILKLHPKIAPYKVAVFPLLANKEELVNKARGIYENLRHDFLVAWDDRGNIGKRYLYQDEIGTPWCVTVDFQTIEDGTVTIRDRDTAKQERVASEELSEYFKAKLT